MISKAHFKTYKKAFSLIELLVVIAVIGILAGIVALNLGNWRGKVYDTSVVSDANSINSAEKLYVLSSNLPGKAWYSGDGTDADLKTSITQGNTADVVVDNSGYCIRVFNASSSSYKNIYSAYEVESATGKCSSISPSGYGTGIATIKGDVTTIAGSVFGYSDTATGPATLAQFRQFGGIAIDSTNTNLYIADSGNNRIRKIVISTGVVSTLAGSGTAASVDGTGTAAQFNSPDSIAIDSTNSNLYVADSAGNKIRKIVIATGVVSTIAGSGAVATAAQSATTAVGTAAVFNSPKAVALSPDGQSLYVAERTNNMIRKIALSTNTVSLFAGSTVGTAGGTDGVGTSATFYWPLGITVDPTGTNIYVADLCKIRKIVAATADVTTFAGTGSCGYKDGASNVANFYYPIGIEVDPTNSYIYVTDGQASVGYALRKIMITDQSTYTIAGTGQGSADGYGLNAKFYAPAHITLNSDGTKLYIAEWGNYKVRLVQ